MAVSYPRTDMPREVMVRFRLTPAEKARLDALASERGRSIAEICRVALKREETRQVSRD